MMRLLPPCGVTSEIKRISSCALPGWPDDVGILGGFSWHLPAQKLLFFVLVDRFPGIYTTCYYLVCRLDQKSPHNRGLLLGLVNSKRLGGFMWADTRVATFISPTLAGGLLRISTTIFTAFPGLPLPRKRVTFRNPSIAPKSMTAMAGPRTRPGMSRCRTNCADAVTFEDSDDAVVFDSDGSHHLS